MRRGYVMLPCCHQVVVTFIGYQIAGIGNRTILCNMRSHANTTAQAFFVNVSDVSTGTSVSRVR